MAKWNLYGTERRDCFEQALEPQELKLTLTSFQKVFGSSFGISELLMLMDIKAKAMIAEGINDAPEFLVDQIGKSSDLPVFTSPSDALYDISESIEQLAESSKHGKEKKK